MTVGSTARPAFLEALSQAHYAVLSRCVILTGNIHDLFPLEVEGVLTFQSVTRVLQSALSQARYPRRGSPERFLVVHVTGSGMKLPSSDDAADLQALVGSLVREPAHLELAALGNRLASIPSTASDERTTSAGGLRAVGDLLRTVARIRAQGIAVRPVAVIVDDADILFPSREMASLSGEDRDSLQYVCDLLRDEEVWPDAETAELRPDFLVLVSPTITEINRRILSLPKTVQIDISLPDDESRRAFVERKLATHAIDLDYGESPDPMANFVADSRGLTIRALDDVITRSQRTGQTIGRAAVVAEVNRELQRRLGNVIQIVYPDHGLEDVVGFRQLKLRLDRLQRRIDDPERAPAGMTVVGPNGSGKTFICEAFAAHTGRTVVSLSQIRSQWYGQTDVLAEMFESALSVFGRILVLVDEAHVAFGSIQDPQTHETEARLARSIIQMMDNERDRGNIFWALMTTRPDLLDPDVVRRGRCSLFVPIFDPEGDDAEEFLAWMLRRFAEDGVSLTDAEVDQLRARSLGFSAGDYREFIGDFLEEREFNPQLPVAGFLDNWTPSAVSLAPERELQTLLAALRCDWRELLPARLRTSSRDDIQHEIDRLRILQHR